MKNPLFKVIVLGFICGAFSVASFHQGTLHILFNYGNGAPFITDLFGRFPAPGWNLALRPSALLGGIPIPVVANQMILGGLFGIVIAALVRWFHLPDLLTGVLVGAVLGTLIGATMFAETMAAVGSAGNETHRMARALLLNSSFGFGAGLLLRPFGVQRAVSKKKS
jgi:hypothetical protein